MSTQWFKPMSRETEYELSTIPEVAGFCTTVNTSGCDKRKAQFGWCVMKEWSLINNVFCMHSQDHPIAEAGWCPNSIRLTNGHSLFRSLNRPWLLHETVWCENGNGFCVLPKRLLKEDLEGGSMKLVGPKSENDWMWPCCLLKGRDRKKDRREIFVGRSTVNCHSSRAAWLSLQASLVTAKHCVVQRNREIFGSLQFTIA